VALGAYFVGLQRSPVMERFGACDSNALLIAQWMIGAKTLRHQGKNPRLMLSMARALSMGGGQIPR
jgi:hypothetical protein